MDPIVVTREVDRSPEDAFTAFTSRMGEWWDPQLSPDPCSFSGVHLDQHVGGRVCLLHELVEAFPIGQVTEWEPGARYAQTFTLRGDHPTRVTVDFEPAAGGTLVTLTHAGWRDSDEAFAEWPALLARFAELG